MKKGISPHLSRNIFLAFMMTPAVIGFLVFYVYVNFDSLVMGFQVKNLDTGNLQFSLGNFAYLFSLFGSAVDNVFAVAFKNTLLFIGIGYAQMILMLACSYFLHKKIFGHKFFKFTLYLPAIIMGTATSQLFKYIIAYDGPLSLIYSALGKEMPMFFKEVGWANFGLAVHGYIFGFASVIYYLGAMNQISPEIFESAKLDGVGWIREIFQIIVPLIWPTLSMLLLMSVIGWPNAGGAVLLLTKGGADTYTLGYWQTERLLEGDQLELSAALGWVQTLIIFPIAYTVRKLLIKADEKIGV